METQKAMSKQSQVVHHQVDKESHEEASGEDCATMSLLRSSQVGLSVGLGLYSRSW